MCLDLETNRVHISRHFIFDEHTFTLAQPTTSVPRPRATKVHILIKSSRPSI